MNNKIDKNKGLANLKRDLSSINKPSLSDGARDKMKVSLMAHVDADLASSLAHSSANFELSRVERASLKERIFEKLGFRKQRSFVFTNFFVYHKKFVSVALSLAIVLSFTDFTYIESNVVFAENYTYVTAVEGDVVLERGGQSIKAATGMEIFEKDKLVTGDDSSVTVTFFDDSVSRLAENTQVQVNKLDGDMDGGVNSDIEVSLLDGNLWSRVVNVSSRYSDFVVEATDIYASTKRGAFNVALENSEVEIKVFNSDVDVRSKNETKKVLSGDRVVVNKRGISEKVEVAQMDAESVEDDWVQKNIESDRVYLGEVENKLLAAKVESLGAESAEDVKVQNSLKGKTLALLTFDDVEQSKIQLNLAEQKFTAAQVTLANEDLSPKDREKAQKAIDDYGVQVEKFYGLIGDVELKDGDYASELSDYIEQRVLVQKKGLMLVSADSPVYHAREVVDNLELLAVNDPASKAELQIRQASERLADAQELAASENAEDVSVAKDVVKKSQRDLSEIATMVAGDDAKSEKIAADVEALEDLALSVQKEVTVKDLGGDLVFGDDVLNLEEKEKIDAQSQVVQATKIDSSSTDSPEDVEVYEKYGVKVYGDSPLPPLLD